MADRYEILEKIGTGGMSDVYKAKDHKLNRHVAVKVLKQEFSENANFVSKFRVEAQAAAGLMHPNIVNVYDVGMEDGIYFIVMELVEGITLKKYIEKKARLSYKEAISIAIQVCMGIEAAHNNHIIHRDIKPQNIIISKEGKVKVTDFGIAKAATSNTITSNVMGSVHYTSPEQARGGYSDEKSDIYSLGITLFEMLTGRVPFNGETTVAIAIKHIQEEMPSPRDFVAEIPVSVEQIVLKCCQKSPDRRYQNMSDVVADLKKALMNPDTAVVEQVDPDRDGATKVIDDVPRLKPEKETKKSSAGSKSKSSQGNKKQSSSTSKKANKYVDDYDDYDDSYDDEYDDYEYDDDDYDYDNRRTSKDPNVERITTIIAVVAAVLIGLIVIFIVARALGIFSGTSSIGKDKPAEGIEENTEQVQMIDVVGREAETVKKALIEAGLTPVTEYEESADFAEGIVIRCSANDGELLPAGTEVIITVSAGKTGVDVPDVVGMTEAEAVSTLVNKGFVPSKTDGFDDYIQAGSIYKQTPEGDAKAPAGATITIYISKGPEETKVAVPNIVGRDEATAMALLTESRLELGEITEVNFEDPAYEGLVCAQSEDAGSFVSEGTKINVSISIGPKDATYKFSDTITAPTAIEDPSFRAGTMVTVTLKAEDGTILLSTQTSEFPIAAQNITGIKSAMGTVIYQYVNQGDTTTITNDDGTVTTIEGSSESKEIARPISFVAE